MYRKLQMERAGSAENIQMVHLDHPMDEPTFQSLVGPAARQLPEKRLPRQPVEKKHGTLDEISLRDLLEVDPELSEFLK